MATTLVRREWIPAGIIAGLVSGLTLELFLIAAQWPKGGAAGALAGIEWAASVAAGNGVLGQPYAVPLGLAVHFAVSVLWALGFLYVAERQPQLFARPFISGLGFGIVVYFLMQALLVPAGKFVGMTIYSFDRDVVAHTLFFGVPLSLIVARLARPR